MKEYKDGITSTKYPKLPASVHALTRSTGSLRLQCHRCGWEGVESELDVNEYGEACPKCPQFRDIHASLSIIENAKVSHGDSRCD